MRYIFFFPAFLAFAVSGVSQDAKSIVIQSVEKNAGRYKEIALDIWEEAELGFREEKSISLLIQPLKEAGFRIETGVAGMPTSFIAEWGAGGPVIGFLAEYDALPAMSQAAVPYIQAREEGKPGHACGHHLFGTASMAAAIAVKDWLAESGTPGRIRLYGTPAEEGGGGKVFMVRAGLFNDVDAVITWHPGDMNKSTPNSTLSAISATFTFTGVASHAARFPERGHSALDGVEAMNHMVNLLREHIPQESRIHYTIKNGGGAANVVPAKASVGYIIRHPDMNTVKDLLRRVNLAASGAAQGTETEVEMSIETGYFNLLPNTTLAGIVYNNLVQIGGVSYNDAELQFANKLAETFPVHMDPKRAEEIEPFDEHPPVTSASTDVGDISWVVPTTSFRAATWVPGTASHSWQAVAAGGMSIGIKGMLVAAKTQAISAVDLFQDPLIIARAKAELLSKRGEDFHYEALLGDIPPPLDYRKDY